MRGLIRRSESSCNGIRSQGISKHCYLSFKSREDCAAIIDGGDGGICGAAVKKKVVQYKNDYELEEEEDIIN